VGVSFVLMTRGKTPAANVAVRETSSLSVNSSPSMTSTPVLAVGPAPVSSAAGQPPAPTPSNPAQVYVVGQVRRPGVVALATDARVEDAIQAAGGATGRADLTEMNLARKIVDGERILVPKPGQAVPAVDPVPAAVDDGAAASGAGPAAAPGAPVDLNTATATELDALPGVGPVLAGRIVAWRQANGGFKQVDDLGEVQGIGDATLAKLRPMVRI
jgi:competence protein ComEA